MNLWQQQGPMNPGPANMTDVVFKMSCASLPVDHAQSLASAVIGCAPWLREIETAGVHPVHVAGSQNGWQRPEQGDVLNLPRRTRLIIRVSNVRASELIETLSGRELDISGHRLLVESGRVRDLIPAASLFSRYVYFPGIDDLQHDETPLVNAVVEWCNQRGFQPGKLLCGKFQTISTDNGPLMARSVLLADVPAAESIVIQSDGIGHQRLLGCGMVLMHKDTGPIHLADE